MIITGIEKNKGTRYTVYVDGEYFYIFDVQILYDFGIKVGLECSEEFLSNVMNAAKRRKAKERALYLLQYRDHSYHELVEKLVKSVDDIDIAEETADKMAKLGFLDDQRYCERLAGEYIVSKKYGVYKAKFELSKKGFDKKLIDECVEAAAEDVDFVEIICGIIESKYKNCLSDRKSIKKTTDALFRRGFSYDDIKQAMDVYADEHDEY